MSDPRDYQPLRLVIDNGRDRPQARQLQSGNGGGTSDAMADRALIDEVSRLTKAVQDLVDKPAPAPKKTLEDRFGTWLPPTVLAALIVAIFTSNNTRFSDLEKKVDAGFQRLGDKIEALDVQVGSMNATINSQSAPPPHKR